MTNIPDGKKNLFWMKFLAKAEVNYFFFDFAIRKIVKLYS